MAALTSATIVLARSSTAGTKGTETPRLQFPLRSGGETWIRARSIGSSTAIRAAHPQVPVIGFPRGAGASYAAFAAEAGVSALALDASVDPAWAARALQPRLCVQGNLDPMLLVVGGDVLEAADARALRDRVGGAGEGGSGQDDDRPGEEKDQNGRHHAT
jgi:hypothetical protein